MLLTDANYFIMCCLQIVEQWLQQEQRTWLLYLRALQLHKSDVSPN